MDSTDAGVGDDALQREDGPGPSLVELRGGAHGADRQARNGGPGFVARDPQDRGLVLARFAVTHHLHRGDESRLRIEPNDEDLLLIPRIV